MIDNTFCIEGLIGQGGSSRVFQVRDFYTGNLSAVKVIRKDWNFSEDRQSRLAEKEFDIMQNLPYHPNFLHSYSYSTQGLLQN